MDFPVTRIKGGVGAPRGFQCSAISCGIKNPAAERLDLALIYSESPCTSAGTFTINRVKAAPVKLSQAHLRKGDIRAIIANSGNANACTGVQGINDAKAMCKGVATPLGLNRSEIGVCSTGVIGLPMPMVRIEQRFDELVEGLGSGRGTEVARAIITSDTHHKEIAISFDLGGHRVRIGGCVKGAGMISPSMATMLCFITTDANVSRDTLRKGVLEAVDESFNRITIDGDTSTNDCCMLIATGKANLPEITEASGPLFAALKQAVFEVCMEVAQAIVRDGEGATKFVTVQVNGGGNHQECLDVGYTVAHSPLIKTALFASDPNWGRILAAVGRAGVPELDVSKIDVFLGEVCIASQGARAATYTEAQGAAVMQQEEITIRIELGRGDCSETIWTTDLSHEYVKINAEYRT